MITTPHIKINCCKVWKYANIHIFNKFYPKIRDVSYNLKRYKILKQPTWSLHTSLTYELFIGEVKRNGREVQESHDGECTAGQWEAHAGV